MKTASFEIRKGEVHCTERQYMEYWLGRREGTMPKRCGWARAPHSPVSAEHKDV
jgi:hypothetical protein